MDYTEEELAGMTEEERAALEELKEMEEGASDDDPEFDPDAEKDDEDEDNDDEGDDGQAGADGAAEGGDTNNAGDDDGDDRDQPGDVRAPLLVAEAPADAEAQLQKISEDKAALVEKFDDGELTAKEYQQQLDALSKQERAIERALDKAQIAADLEMQRQENEKQQAINTFLAEVGIPRDPSNLRFATLDAAVRLVASKDENANLGPREILQKAHDLCVEQGTLQGKKAPAPKADTERKPARKPIEAPRTLAGVPASEISDTDSARFAHITRIKDPDAREREFAKLSPAEQDAFLQMGG